MDNDGEEVRQRVLEVYNKCFVEVFELFVEILFYENYFCMRVCINQLEIEQSSVFCNSFVCVIYFVLICFGEW